MEHIEYKARILPDGHLPLPEGVPAKAGDEVDVTISLPATLDGEAEARKRSDYLFTHWVGVGQGSSADLAERHDDYLSERE